MLKSFPVEFELEQRLILGDETFETTFQNINKEAHEDYIVGYVEVIDSVSPICYNGKKYVGVSVFKNLATLLGIQVFDYNGSIEIDIDTMVKILGGEIVDLSDKG